jgi:hypothetical protein
VEAFTLVEFQTRRTTRKHRATSREFRCWCLLIYGHVCDRRPHEIVRNKFIAHLVIEIINSTCDTKVHLEMIQRQRACVAFVILARIDLFQGSRGQGVAFAKHAISNLGNRLVFFCTALGMPSLIYLFLSVHSQTPPFLTTEG